MPLAGLPNNWIDYSSYRDLLSLSLLTSTALFPWLMTKPSRCLGLRFTSSFALIIGDTLAEFAPRSRCPERIVFDRIDQVSRQTKDDASAFEL